MTQTLPRLLMENTDPVDHDGTIELLSKILADTVRLTGAACIGRHELFGQTPGNGGHQHQRQEQIRRAEAARLCAGCPAIQHCTSVTVSTELKNSTELKRPA
jgi:hypothetical protein